MVVPDIQGTQEKGVLDLNPRSDPMACIRPGRLELLPWVCLKYNVKVTDIFIIIEK